MQLSNNRVGPKIKSSRKKKEGRKKGKERHLHQIFLDYFSYLTLRREQHSEAKKRLISKWKKPNPALLSEFVP